MVESMILHYGVLNYFSASYQKSLDLSSGLTWTDIKLLTDY